MKLPNSICYLADFSMQKEAEGGGDKESKEERAQDAPEQTVRKRVRANTPSPHRENTPQGETHRDKKK